MKIRDINCSYSLIETNSPETLQKLINLLSVYVPGYQYTPQYKAGIWDGKQSFFKLIPQGMVIPKGLAELVIQKFSHMLEEPYQKCYNTEKITKEELLEFIKELNLPFEPRDYQIDAVLYALNNTNGIVISATGSGKSLMIYILLMYQYKKLNNKSLLIVPNVSLVEQMYNDFKDYGLTNIDETVHKIYSGKPKHFEKPITISTWQSIYKNKEMFEDIGCIVVDECHRARSESINTIIQASINSKYKIGFTGTLPDDNITDPKLQSAKFVADNTLPGGLATTGYDDEGVECQRWDIIKNGIFVGYSTTREVAGLIGLKRSYGSARAEDFSYFPINRIPNLILLPNEDEMTPEEMMDGIKDGILIDGAGSFSIDQMRLNFQFGGDLFYEIKDGKRGRMLKNVIYYSITPQFWGSLDAVSDKRYWEPYGFLTCAKGEPEQLAQMTNGAPYARFRKIKVGRGK